jgi:DNA-binding SARP family transcriptional activator
MAGEDAGATPYELVAGLLRELRGAVGAAGGSALGRILDTAGEAVDVWTSRREQLAAHERALDRAVAAERAARDQIGLLLTIGIQLAAAPGAAARPAPDPAPAASGGAGLVAHLLGAFEVRLGGRPVSGWRGRRGPALLQLLITRRGTPITREALTEALWPEIAPDLGRHRTHQAVYALRQTLQRIDPGREHIVCCAGAYRLGPDLPLWTDVAEFERLVAVGARCDAAARSDEAFAAYRAADRLYRGDFVAGTVPGEWAATERRRLQAVYVVAGNRLSALHAERGDHAAALGVCAKVLERDAWHEEVIRRAMGCYAASGNPSQALRLFRSFEAELAAELGVAPSAATRRVVEELSPARGR